MSTMGQWHFEEKGINWWPTSAESHKLNPIEIVWCLLKEAIRNYYKPRTLDQLEDAIKQRHTCTHMYMYM